jgi:hypothetical protein
VSTVASWCSKIAATTAFISLNFPVPNMIQFDTYVPVVNTVATLFTKEGLGFEMPKMC